MWVGEDDEPLVADHERDDGSVLLCPSMKTEFGVLHEVGIAPCQNAHSE